MPSALHKLDVDRSKLGGGICKRSNIEVALGKEGGGMNWGAIAVYSCAMSCDLSRTEFVVVQESGDGVPKRKAMKLIEPGSCSDEEVDTL